MAARDIYVERATYIGVTFDYSADDNVALCISIFRKGDKNGAQQEFKLTKSAPDIFLTAEKDEYPVDMQAVSDFLNCQIDSGDMPRIVVSIPFEATRPLPAKISKYSPLIKLLYLFSKKRWSGFKHVVAEDQTVRIVPRWVLQLEDGALGPLALLKLLASPEEDDPRSDVLFLSQSMCRAYATLMYGSDTLRDIAHATALVGASEGLYLCITSLGRVHSSGDIVSFFKTELGNVRVVGAGDVFSISQTSSTVKADVHDVALEYALTINRFNYLSETDALKFALLSVCQKWNLCLQCAVVADTRLDEPVVFEPAGSTHEPLTPALRKSLSRVEKKLKERNAYYGWLQMRAARMERKVVLPDEVVAFEQDTEIANKPVER